MSLVDEIIEGFKAQLSARVLNAIAGAILTVGLARLLNPDLYGLLFLALAVVGVFELVARFGIARSAGRYVAEYAQKDAGQITFIVRTALVVNLVTIFLVVMALAIGYRWIADVLDEPALESLLLIGTLVIATGTTLTFVRKVLQGFEAIRSVALLDVVDNLLRLVFVLGLVAATFGVVGAMFGYLVSGFCTALLGAAYLFRHVKRYHDPSASVEAGLRRRIVEYAIPITATNTSKILDNRVDTLLVGFFLTPLEVSYYVISTQVVHFLETPMSALDFTLSPTFGSQKAAGNLEELSRIYENALVNVLLVYIPAGIGIVLVAGALIPLLFGASYGGAIVVLQVFAIYMVLKAVTKITDNGLDYLGRARERAIARGATAMLNVLLNVLLIPLIGVVGAAIATVITHGIYTGFNLYIAGQEFHMRVRFLVKRIGQICLISGMMAVIVVVLTPFISGWPSLIGVVVVGVVVWAILSVKTGLLRIGQVVAILG